jgi:hypothetical protein
LGCTSIPVVCYSLGMSENKTSHKRPVIVASTVLILGTAASLAINVKAINLTDAPEAGAYVSGLAWPLALLLVIELMIHTPWADNWRDRFTKAAALAIVGGIAAWISYWHGVHVLAHWNYDAVGQHVGPLVADVAMGVATLALNRIGQARRMANEVATMATGQPATVATVATDPMADLASDWANLEDEMAAYVAAEQARPVSAPPAPAEEPAAAEEPAQVPAKPATKSALTTVPAEAAKRINEALELDPAAPAARIAADLVAAGVVSSDRSGRRFVAAIKNGTARVA